MTAHSIISRFNHLNGNAVTLETLRTFHNDVQKQLDAESHGPHSAQLTEIRQRLAKRRNQQRNNYASTGRLLKDE